jgi:hypothetical protein
VEILENENICNIIAELKPEYKFCSWLVLFLHTEGLDARLHPALYSSLMLHVQPQWTAASGWLQ